MKYARTHKSTSNDRVYLEAHTGLYSLKIVVIIIKILNPWSF